MADNTTAAAPLAAVPIPVPRLTEPARVVPWSDWNEWRRLRADARGDARARKRASATLAGWRLRRVAGMPVAIEADVALRALAAECERGYEWRLAVGMAIVRLVNGLTDQLQPKATSSIARSVRSLADTMNLPSALVAIRHQATHNNLPSANTLNQALVTALEWIDIHYWNAQDQAAQAQGPQSVPELAKLFQGGPWVSRLPPILPIAPPVLPSSSLSDNQEGDDILARMEAAIPRLEQAAQERRKQSKVQAPRKRWRPCGNQQAWKFTPLGLCPWQTQVDSMHDYENASHSENDHEENLSDDNITLQVNQVNDTHIVKKRRLTEEEIRFVQRRRKELLA